jgi:hypothetical protein
MAIADPQSFNRYSYVNNDPVNKVDPLGLMLSDIGIYQTDNPAEARYLEKNATWKTLRSAAADQLNYILTEPMSLPLPDGASASNAESASNTESAAGGREDAHASAPGAWVFWIHNQIIDQAFPGLSARERSYIKSASADVDEDQSTEGSYKHAMRSPRQTELVAAVKATLFIVGALLETRRLQAEHIAKGGSGISHEALYALGKAVHTLTDSTSPSHKGFQKWFGFEGPINKIRAATHAAGELKILPAQMKEAVTFSRSAFTFAFGGKLAKQAFRSLK